jgi:mannose-6-phosphate isomerase-like protein (cupin superfamily)
MKKTKPKIIVRPWGKEIVLTREKNFWVKDVFIKNGHRASLQNHKGRKEIWIALSGKSAAVLGNKYKHLNPGDIVKINKGQKHRWIGVRNSRILEIAFGKLDERDIIRYQDDYGRMAK